MRTVIIAFLLAWAGTILLGARAAIQGRKGPKGRKSMANGRWQMAKN